MYRKSKVLKCGGYSDLRRNQDVDLFGRMLLAGCKAANIDESLLLFRVNKNLLKRRKSWENSASYISIIYKFWKMGYSSFIDFILVFIGQIFVLLCPLKVQSWLYQKLLRKY